MNINKSNGKRGYMRCKTDGKVSRNKINGGIKRTDEENKAGDT